ncbi:hypothetical protein FQN57_007217 [Myotisia sp. PD_48]|nr:hypothetical protein FQN57_007217 [Myotisia sp. PD_48]
MASRDFRRQRGGNLTSSISAAAQNIPVIPLNKHVREYMKALDSLDAPEDWSSNPELPSPEEALGTDSGEEILLVPNQVEGPWISREIYLKTHYNLLREDGVAPLRDAVAYFRNEPGMLDSPDCCIYEKVHFTGLQFAQTGIAVRIQFSTSRAGKKIVWEYSSRLMAGSIVALTPANDCFKTTCIVAVVAARPLDSVKASPSEIDLFFANPNHAEFDYQREWIMVQARCGYYEAVRHSMTALQKMASECFPLCDHICNLDPDIQPPEYLQARGVINLSSAMANEGEQLSADIRRPWPPHPKTLDSSQWMALKHILTQRLSIVQGPPGTGKTYVSVVALKIMLENMRSDDPPIIIAAQTNHALDQLLRLAAEFEPNYIRLGGRSMDPDIKKRTLFEVRQKANLPFIAGGALSPARRILRELTSVTLKLFTPFRIENSNIPLQPSFLLELGLITLFQHDSLLRGAAGWVHTNDRNDPMSAWLGDNLVKYEVVYKTETFGFDEEEIDIEYEQLKELEREQGLLDEDDYESLKGQYIALREFFVARVARNNSDQDVDERYLRLGDLWNVPLAARAAVYASLQRRAKEAVLQKFREILVKYNEACKEITIGKWERDSVILQEARIIGMTTTGLSKYRGLVSSIKPKIILIEEAAEVLEAPIAAACIESLQHLILVGDHQQLQGSCALEELEDEPFYLNVSMFERLVRNSFPYAKLAMQRRMRPEIRKILAPIYADLQDHPSVINRANVPGMGGVNSYFFTHTWLESSDSLSSRFNASEAKMVIGFYIYLHMNGVPVKDMTILTFYNGQRKMILKSLKSHPLFQHEYTKVVTVDSYQGEENEIVLLSLVRSNEKEQIGFLENEHRICVALSRAKAGFYIFGNAELLSVASGLWWQVAQILRKQPKRIGLQCQVKCGRLLPCGHKCAEVCFRACKCDCEALTEPLTLMAGNIFRPATLAEEQLTPRKTTEEHSSFIRRYNDYATGGVQVDDARLARETERLVINEKLKQMDEQAHADLFGDCTASSLLSENQNVMATEAISKGKTGVRTKYTQFYTNQPAHGSGKDDSPSLLD